MRRVQIRSERFGYSQAHRAERAVEMLAYWGIDASAHRPRQVGRAACDQAGAIFAGSPPIEPGPSKTGDVHRHIS